MTVGETFLSAISVYEIEHGILLLEGKDKRHGSILRAWMDTRILPEFEGRILPTEAVVAQRCARFHIPEPRPMRDALIAATALVHGISVVTGNVRDFEPIGVETLNPWK